MPDLAPTAPSPAGTADGIAPAHAGQLGSSAPSAAVGTPQPGGEQPRSDAPGAVDPGQASPPEAKPAFTEKDYKNLQAAFTRVSQTLAGLGDLTQLQKERALIAQLRQDKEFVDWARARAAKQQAGSDDPETVRALEIVDARAREIAREMVAPLQAQALQTKLTTTFAEMDEAYGPDWRPYMPQMKELLDEGIQRGWFRPDVEYNFDTRFVKSLYAAVIAADPDYAAAQHQKKLEAKRSNTTTATPGTAPSAVSTGSTDTIEAAFAQAKRQLGVA